MDVKKEKHCRLCFRVAEGGYEIIDDVTKMMLEVLMIELNWELCRDPVMCQECAEITRKSYYFKSTCVDKSNCVWVKDELGMKAMCKDGRHTETVILENNSACAFCMSQVKSGKHFSMGVLLNDSKIKGIFLLCMPEVDLDVMKSTTVCIPCGENFKTYFNFVSSCLEVEEKINAYIKSEDIDANIDQIKLSGNHNFMFETNVKLSPTSTLSNEVKQELEVSEDCTQLEVPSYDTIKNEEIIIPDEPNVNNNVEEMYKCESCPFKTSQKYDFKIHVLVHQTISEMKTYKCDICTYETNNKHCLSLHMPIHMDISDIKTHKCRTCWYETRWKRNLKVHSLIHKDMKMYKCERCSYETKRKDSLKVHSLTHRDISEVEMYKCHHCTFETKWKDCLKRHILTHGNDLDMYEERRRFPFETNTNATLTAMNATLIRRGGKQYKCGSCSYQTNRRDCLNAHSLRHKDISEVKTYECESCPYKTKWKRYLKKHVLNHQHGLEAGMYKCDSCTFETKDSKCLSDHILTHTETLEEVHSEILDQ